MVSAIKRIRISLGAAREEMLYGRDNRKIAEAATAARPWIEAARLTLPALPPRPAMPALEVHCVTGEKQMAMAGWCAWSLMRFLPEAQLVLHDDGSLTPESRAEMARILPGLRVVSREERTQAMHDAIGGMTHLIDWIESYHLGFKHAVQFAAGSNRILEMDTDVLTIGDPAVLRQWAGDPAIAAAWNVDMHYSFSYPEALFKDVLGDLIGPLPDRLNSGLLLLDRLSGEEWDRLGEIVRRLDADPRTDPLRFWMQQTLHGLIVSRRAPAIRPLPGEYDVYHGPSRGEVVVRHFVGSPRTRPRFFTEGIPRLIAAARQSGHLPEDFAAEHVPLSGR